MPRRQPRPYVPGPLYGVQGLNSPTQIIPAQQLARHYGGQANFQQLLDRAQRGSDATYSAMSDIDPEMMELFPPVNYDAYNQPVSVEPQRMLPADVGGQYVGPIDAMSGDMVQTPAGTFVPSPTSNPALLVNPGFDPRLAMAEGLEKPITDMVTDDRTIPPLSARRYGMTDFSGREGPHPIPYGLLDMEPGARGGVDPQMTSPEYTDRTLAQLRRHSGRDLASPDDAEAYLNEVMADAEQAYQGGMADDAEYIPRAGVALKDLMALLSLPQNVQRYLPTRMTQLLGAGGVGAGIGLGAGGGMSSDRDRPTMNANYTMGPLSGLYQ